MIKIYNYGQVPNEEVFARENISANVETVVADIIADVRKNGDDALYAYAAKFDKATLTANFVDLHKMRQKPPLAPQERHFTVRKCMFFSKFSSCLLQIQKISRAFARDIFVIQTYRVQFQAILC